MQISGEMIEGRRIYRGGSNAVYALTAASGERMEPGFGTANEEDVARACLSRKTRSICIGSCQMNGVRYSSM